MPAAELQHGRKVMFLYGSGMYKHILDASMVYLTYIHNLLWYVSAGETLL